MANLKIALLQMLSAGPDLVANRAKGEQFCIQAKEMGADLALFPEMWSNGYTLPEKTQPELVPGWRNQAVARDGEFVTHFRDLARELDMAIALTYLEKWPDRPRNSLSLIDRHGEIRLTYAKVHTCEWDREVFLTPGEEFGVVELDTAAGPVQVGAMICFDREFPESARVLMLQGAEIVLTPNACELELNRLAQYRTRAYENMFGMAMANYAAPQENGHSVAFDGIAFDEAGTRDMCLVQADAHEGVYLAEFDLERLRAYRANEVWGNAYRRPGRYANLTDPAVRPPFVRPDATRG
jgi:N-carbamoylputrescine amidase